MELRNPGDRPRRLSVYAFADFVIGNVSQDAHEGQGHALQTDTIVGDGELLFFNKFWHTENGWSEEAAMRTAVARTLTGLSRKQVRVSV